MQALATALVAILAALAGLHAYWGFGGRWPGHDDASLVGYVIGRTKEMRAPTPAACFGVAACLLAASTLAALHGARHTGGAPGIILRIAYWGAALVFLLRGVAGFIPSVTRYASGTPFHRLNLLVYSPLCLLIAAGFAAL